MAAPPAENTPSPDDLAARAQSGDQAAFAALVRHYDTSLLRYLWRMLGNAQDAEDAFQETFLRVYRNLHKYRTDMPFRPWLYRIATNVCRDRQRYLRLRRWTSLDAPLGGDNAGAATLADHLAANGAQTDAPAREKEAQQRIEAELAKLSPKHRAVFLLARYEGLGYDEIAKVLRIPVGTVKSRMNKAVGLLLRELEDLC